MSPRRYTDGPDWVKILLAALVAVLAVVLVLMVSKGAESDDSARADVLAAATTAAISLTTYDHDQLDRDFAWVSSGATDEFAEEYALANEPLRDIVTQLKADAVGTVIEASATVEDNHRATVLLFVDQTITNGTDDKRRTERNRLVMTMVRQGGVWLVDDVELR